jgi:plasmid stabilization system protein ParE
LRLIVAYIAQNNPVKAESFGYLLISKLDLLPKFPQMGRVVPEQSDETVRELVFRDFRIIYKYVPDSGTIAVARIWHGARGTPEIPR